MLKRPLYEGIWKDLSTQKAMVFMAGPRQAGKTTFARMVAAGFSNSVYFNWDLLTHRRQLLADPLFFEKADRKDSSAPLVILDEIHKYKKWKNYLKGVYDQEAGSYRFLVLGSGRLNVFQKGGDSLVGRYFMFTLWPFTLAELAQSRRPFADFMKDPLKIADGGEKIGRIWAQLARLSGFPEPYLSGRETVYRRWSRTYDQQLIREDIRNMTGIKDIGSTEVLFSLLPSKVGSPLSLAGLANDLQVSFKSVRNWVDVFESFFMVFRVGPWTKKIVRAITKERKLYLYDYAGIPSDSSRLENAVALELWRAVSNWNDLGLGDFRLHYLRNRQGEEVDFLVADGSRPVFLVEVKSSETETSQTLRKFQSLLKVPAVQLVGRPNVYRLVSNADQKILVSTASAWLATLP